MNNFPCNSFSLLTLNNFPCNSSVIYNKLFIIDIINFVVAKGPVRENNLRRLSDYHDSSEEYKQTKRFPFEECKGTKRFSNAFEEYKGIKRLSNASFIAAINFRFVT